MTAQTRIEPLRESAERSPEARERHGIAGECDAAARLHQHFAVNHGHDVVASDGALRIGRSGGVAIEERGEAGGVVVGMARLSGQRRERKYEGETAAQSEE